jgi:hypothetical protein
MEQKPPLEVQSAKQTEELNLNTDIDATINVNTNTNFTKNKQRFIDKKLIAGLALGVTIAAGTATFASFNQETFGNNASTSGTSSQISTHLAQSAAECAAGKEGTLGGAIKSAMKMHEELANVAPKVEDLFGQQCMQNLSQLMDMSNFVGSIYASLLGTITDQFKAMIQKNVCKVIDKATGLVMNPINEAINKVNTGLGGIEGKVNGFAIEAFQTPSKKIDAALQLDTTPVDTLSNGLNSAQAFKDINTKVTDGSNIGNATSGMPDPRIVAQNITQGMQQNNAALTLANQTYNNNQAQLVSALPEQIKQAQQNLTHCQNSNSNDASGTCLNEHLALNSLTTTQSQLAQQNTSLTNIINAQPAGSTGLNVGSLK